MERIHRSFVGLLAWAVWASLATLAQAQGTGAPSTPSPGTTAPTGRSRSTPRDTRQVRLPSFITGRVLINTGKPAPEPVSVELNCGTRALQVIRTDLGGYFTFNIGGMSQGNVDFSASTANPSGFGSSLGSSIRESGGTLFGCELRVMVPGYHPMTLTITQQEEMGQLDVGTLRLQRIAGVQGSAISVTSLLVPSNARKEFQKALKDVENKKLDSAQQHLQKAIDMYAKYAAAWNELGRIHLAREAKEKATQAFQNAIGSDPDYLPPYLSLATLQIQSREWQAAVDTATKVLEMDSSISYASLLQAVGNFNLNHLEAAEQSARQAEKGAHDGLPQVHALLADILLQRHAYEEAVQHMRTYLEEAPEGQYAARMKEALAQLQAQNPALAAPPVPASKPGS